MTLTSGLRLLSKSSSSRLLAECFKASQPSTAAPSLSAASLATTQSFFDVSVGREIPPYRNRQTLHVSSSLSTPRRYLSTSAASSEHGKGPEIVLYEKTPGHLRLVRSGFGFSCFHSLYWIWYAVDFVPTVNAAQMSELHVGPVIPTIGVFFAFIVQAIFTGYPLRLVSKLSWRPVSREFLVYKHSLPLITPAKKASVHEVGEVRIDPASKEARHIATQGQLHNFAGMVTIGKTGQWPPFLIDIRNPSEVREPEILLEILLEPERIDQDRTNTNRSRTNTNREMSTAIRSKKKSGTKRLSRHKRR